MGYPYIFFTLLLAACLSAPLHGQEPARLDSFLRTTTNDFGIPAMSVSVVKDGEVVLDTAYGQRGSHSTEKADPQTRFAIASLSKAFTVASVGMLVDEGKLQWDDKVRDHLPWFALHDAYVAQNMTVEDLLCHRSGLITFDGDLLWYGSDYDRREIVERIRHRPLTHGFREKFGYQNIMYITAGELIEAVSGMSWDEFVRTRILEPLDMQRTTSDFEAFSQDENRAAPTLEGQEIPMLSYENSGATAALNSTSEDMSKWMRFWLDRGVVEGDTLLDPETVGKIWQLHTPLTTSGFDRQKGTHFKGYGLGWFLLDYDGVKVIHHGGGLPGYISKTVVVPERDLAFTVLSNSMSPAPGMLLYAIMDWDAGRAPGQWKSPYLNYHLGSQRRAEEKRQERLEAQDLDAERLSANAYQGSYRDSMYGGAEISLEGDEELRLTLLPAADLFTATLEPFGEHAFKFEFKDPFLPFGIINFELEDQQVTGFTIDLPNDDFHFYKLEFKKE